MKSKLAMAAVALGATVFLAAAPAEAQRGYYHGHGGHYYRGGGVAAGIIGGLAAGALIGGALASRPGYYYGAGYGYGYAPGNYYEPSYAYVPAPAYGPGAVAYCAQRFKSYDPASGTYLGNDGYRHPCP
jgi:hypothetical protein